MTLAQLPVGKEGVIETVGGEGNLRCRFLDMGLIPGTKVKVLKMAPMGDPIQIHLRGYDITIRKEDGEKIVLKEGSCLLYTSNICRCLWNFICGKSDSSGSSLLFRDIFYLSDFCDKEFKNRIYEGL